MPFDIGQLLSTIFSQALGGGGAAQGVRPSNGMAPQFGGGLFGGAFQNTHGTGAFTANPYISQVASVANQAGARSGLPSLDANTQNALNQITNATNMKLNQQFQDRANALTANLYGMGNEHSSGANAAMSRMLQDNQLVSAQAQADAAQRFLGQQNTSADRSLQGLGMQQQGLGQAAGLTNEQNQMQFQQQQQQLQMLVSLLPTLLQAHQSIGGGGPQPHAQEDFAHSAQVNTPRPVLSQMGGGGYSNSGGGGTGWQPGTMADTTTRLYGNDPHARQQMLDANPQFAGSMDIANASKALSTQNPMAQFGPQIEGAVSQAQLPGRISQLQGQPGPEAQAQMQYLLQLFQTLQRMNPAVGRAV